MASDTQTSFCNTAVCDPSNPFLVAMHTGDADVVEALISQEVDVDAKTADGQTPFQLAVACEHDEIAEMLRRHGATG